MEFFLKYKRLFLYAVIAVTVVMGYGLTLIGTDFSFDSFFPRDEEFEFYEEFKKSFPSETNQYFIAIENDGKDVLDAKFLEEVDSLFQQFGRLKNVDTVFSPIHLPWLQRTPGGVKSENMVDYSSPEALELTRERLAADTAIAVNFFARNNTIICGMVSLKEELQDFPERDTLTWHLENVIYNLPHKGIVTGVPAIRTAFIVKINQESLLFISLSIVLTFIILILTYRSFWGVVVPMIGVLTTVAWTMGIMGLFDKKIDLMFMLLPTIMFVVATSALVHLVTKYIQELQTGKTRQEAIASTIRKIGAAILLTNVTTAIGFASLSISKIPPMRDFGIFSALGVMIAFFIAMVIGPNVLTSIPPERIANKKGVGNSKIWERMLAWINDFTENRRALVMIAFGVIIGISAVGMSLISFNTYLLEDMPRHDKVYTSLAYLEENFFGMSPLELAVVMKNGHKITDLEVLEELDQVEAYVRTQTKVSPFFSPGAILKNANRLNHFGRNKYYALPNKQEKVDEILSFAIASGGEKVLQAVMTKDYSLGRVSARINDLGTDNFHALNDSITHFARTHTDTTKFEIRMTGTAVLAEHNVLYFRQALFYGLLMAFIVVGSIMGFLFKSWKMLFVALIPNLIPVLFCAGMMGILGITLTTAASIIFVISFGIAVDDTIHFLSRFKQEIGGGATINRAIRNTMLGTGKALIITTVILTGGFVMLTLSNFGGVFVVGLFVCLTLSMGLLADIFLLPVLLRWVYSKEIKAQQEMEKE
ncbi:MAG: MMPL family transporter [Bacteroidia bacterium]|nr:MMPL family transporter [Bacteroidia bacterium]